MVEECEAFGSNERGGAKLVDGRWVEHCRMFRPSDPGRSQGSAKPPSNSIDSPTGAERYFAERMTDPDYAAAYAEALPHLGWGKPGPG